MGESLVWVLGGEGNIPESITDVMCNGSSTAEVCLKNWIKMRKMCIIHEDYIMRQKSQCNIEQKLPSHEVGDCKKTLLCSFDRDILHIYF